MFFDTSATLFTSVFIWNFTFERMNGKFEYHQHMCKFFLCPFTPRRGCALEYVLPNAMGEKEVGKGKGNGTRKEKSRKYFSTTFLVKRKHFFCCNFSKKSCSLLSDQA